MNDGTMLFHTNSSICQVVVLKYFEASKTVRSRGMMQTGTDLAAEAGVGMDTTADIAATHSFSFSNHLFLRRGMGKPSRVPVDEFVLSTREPFE
jgi:hypothetical protein